MSQFLIFLLIIIISGSCQYSNTTQLDSDNFATNTARIAVLEQEIIIQSPIQQAEFELFNVNGFVQAPSSLPGTSSWDYKIAIKVAPSSLSQWTEGFKPVLQLEENLDWMDIITQKRRALWDYSSPPEFFIRENAAVYMIIYRKEGIIFKSMRGE